MAEHSDPVPVPSVGLGRRNGQTPISSALQRESRFFAAASLEGKPVPPRHWLVPELVPSGTVTLLGGDGGTGKSLLALQLAVAATTGGDWIGRDVAGGGAIYLSAEDDEHELHRRLADVVRAEGKQFSDLDRLTLRSLAGEDALLATLDRTSGNVSPSPLYLELEKRLKDENPTLLILDTLADLFPGNENDRSQVRQFIGLLNGLAIRHKCAVMLLGHPSLSGMSSGRGTSGSTAWGNSVRSRLYLSRRVAEGSEANPDARVLTPKKANYSGLGDEIALIWKDGVLLAKRAEAGPHRCPKSDKAEQVFLKLLRLFLEQGRRVNAISGQTYAPNVFANHPEAEGVTKRGFCSAMEALLTKEQIRVAIDGPPSKRRSFLDVAE